MIQYEINKINLNNLFYYFNTSTNNTTIEYNIRMDTDKNIHKIHKTTIKLVTMIPRINSMIIFK